MKYGRVHARWSERDDGRTNPVFTKNPPTAAALADEEHTRSNETAAEGASLEGAANSGLTSAERIAARDVGASSLNASDLRAALVDLQGQLLTRAANITFEGSGISSSMGADLFRRVIE